MGTESKLLVIATSELTERPNEGQMDWSLKKIIAEAPTRILDFGGWSDTAFARSGQVLNFAIRPAVRVEIAGTGSPGVQVSLPDLGDAYVHSAGAVRHSLIDLCIDHFIKDDSGGILVKIFSDAPPGASTGTSASLLVALIGALAAYCDEHLTQKDIVTLAHQIETQGAGREAGLQDYVPAAYGGVNLVHIPAYPYFEVEAVAVDPVMMRELAERIVLVYVGSHDSSEIHQRVIQKLGDDPDNSSLTEIRALVPIAHKAVCDADLGALADVMIRSTDTQSQLHQEILSDPFRAVINCARQHMVAGYKLNGAGGLGGSITLLKTIGASSQALDNAVVELGYRVLPITFDHRGLVVERVSV